MKNSKWDTLTIDELQQRENELRKELFNLTFQSATGEIQNPRRIRIVKKDIARALTFKTQTLKKSG